MPSSATVFTSGRAVVRLIDETAKARIFLDSTNCSMEGVLGKNISTCPPRTSVIAGPAPLYGA